MQKKWPIIIRDDRGKDVPLTPPAKYNKKNFGGVFRSRYIGNHAGHGVESKASLSAGALYGGLAGVTMIGTKAIAGFALQGYNGIGKQWFIPIIAGMLAWPFFPFVVRHVRQKRAVELRSAYLKARHCASCDYDLSNLPVESDECTLCPECNAAWKLQPAPAPLSEASRSKAEDFAKRFIRELESAR